MSSKPTKKELILRIRQLESELMRRDSEIRREDIRVRKARCDEAELIRSQMRTRLIELQRVAEKHCNDVLFHALEVVGIELHLW